ncbi:hypothetical protein AB1Y20_000781 [Prymnesium parvum]|uniref:Protein pelota homolog n=1 Tax=Prymnesium parvum TaxID=97485 RepID=A0AB34K6V6_PRYPA
MRLVRSGGDAFARGAEGFGEVTLLPEEIEDLWHVFNLLAVGDAVAATTFRKVTKESTTGAVDSQRVKLLLCVRVSKIDFDPEGGALRVGGAVLTEHESVRLGSHHTLELEVHRQLTLTKDNWDSVSLGRIQEATGGPATTADVAAVLVQHGLAHVCLVSGGMTVTKARLEVQVPKKGSAAVMAGAKKAVERWHEQILQAVLRHVDFSRIKCVILAGPGFTKDGFWEWMCEMANKRDLRDLLLSKPKWVVAHASSAHKHAIKEVLLEPSVAARVADTKAAAEVFALKSFFEMLASDPQRVTYGYRYVLTASEHGAIEKLLITDNLFRVQDVRLRKQYVELVDATKAAGAKVHIFSSMHISGDQLAKQGGLAAILRFPLPIDDMVAAKYGDQSSDSDQGWADDRGGVDLEHDHGQDGNFQ